MSSSKGFYFKIGDRRLFDKAGNFAGPAEMKEPTYYETLLVVNGLVKCTHIVSRQFLLNREYIEISEEEYNYLFKEGIQDLKDILTTREELTEMELSETKEEETLLEKETTLKWIGEEKELVRNLDWSEEEPIKEKMKVGRPAKKFSIEDLKKDSKKHKVGNR